jgi:hypothetical protein
LNQDGNNVASRREARTHSNNYEFSMTQLNTTPVQPHHVEAAKHHEEAAKSHVEAAKLSDAGKHEAAAHQALAAHGNTLHALDHSEAAAKLHATTNAPVKKA